MTRSVSRAFTEQMAIELEKLADPKTKAWWSRYLKGTASFRGVKMADTRRVVKALVSEPGLEDATAERYLSVAQACIDQSNAEDKIAGVLLLAEHGLGSLTIDHVDDLAAPLASGSIGDWNVCDWYCVKFLGPFVVAGEDIEDRAREIAAWKGAERLWHSHAAAVTFVYLAPTEPELFDGFTAMLLNVCEANVADRARFSQTSVGWLLRELSIENPSPSASLLSDIQS